MPQVDRLAESLAELSELEEQGYSSKFIESVMLEYDENEPTHSFSTVDDLMKHLNQESRGL